MIDTTRLASNMGAPGLAVGYSTVRGFIAEFWSSFIFVLFYWANLIDNKKWSFVNVFAVSSWVAV